MARAASRRLVVGGAMALALPGLWLGHTLEYVRAWGTAGLTEELYGSVHAYMLPLAAGIGLLGCVFALRLWRVWARLGRRLDAAHGFTRTLLRGGTVKLPRHDLPRDAAPSFWAGVAVAWPALTLIQVVLYLVQENVEAAVAGVPAPGLGAISGVHALAPLVHAGVALLIVTAAAAILRVLRHRGSTVAAVEAVVRALLRALTSKAPAVAAPATRDLRAPLQLLGLRLRQRPPPATLLFS